MWSNAGCRPILPIAVLVGGLAMPLSAADSVPIEPERSAQQPADDSNTPIAVTNYQAPKAIKRLTPAYPWQDQADAAEGWVTLNTMVDVNGKPHDVDILGSSGNPRMERLAIESLRKWQFAPAAANGELVEGATQINFVFNNPGYMGRGASVEFVKLYRRFRDVAAAGDRAAADAVIAKMKVTNLYEDAYRGLVDYWYADKWGTPADRLAGLNHALALNPSPPLLSKDVAVSVLWQQIKLQLELGFYGEALNSCQRLLKTTTDKRVREQVQAVIDSVQAFRARPQVNLATQGRINDQGASWSLELVRQRFHIEMNGGRISEIQLRCQKKHVLFSFDPELTYDVKGSAGDCVMSLVGTSGVSIPGHQQRNNP